MSRPPCHRSKNRAFIAPDTATRQAISAAKKICGACPRRTDCALEGLNAGELLGRGEAVEREGCTPASGSIYAGVVCTGDEATAAALAEIAGVDTPHRATSTRRKSRDTCISCGKPMLAWGARGMPPGHVAHYARGYCTKCRVPYEEAKKAGAWEPRHVLQKDRRRKPTNTKRFTECKVCGRALATRGRPAPPGMVERWRNGLCVDCHEKRVETVEKKTVEKMPEWLICRACGHLTSTVRGRISRVHAGHWLCGACHRRHSHRGEWPEAAPIYPALVAAEIDGLAAGYRRPALEAIEAVHGVGVAIKVMGHLISPLPPTPVAAVTHLALVAARIDPARLETVDMSAEQAQAALLVGELLRQVS